MSDVAELSTNESLSSAFSRFGRIGFWSQIIIGCVPVGLFVSAFVFGGKDGVGTRDGVALIRYLMIASVLVLAFTTIWFYRYRQLGARMVEPGRRPSLRTLQRAAWTGVAASSIGIVFSVLVAMIEVVQLLLYFLRAPQAGIPVIQTTGSGSASWVSAGDMVSLMGLISSMLIEIIVLALSLWLLFRTYRAAEEDYIADEA